MTATSADGPVRDCTHPVAKHQHGTRTAYACDACRCPPCTDAAAAAERHRTRMIAYGQWEPYVDAEPVRAHVRALSDQGMGWRRIAGAAGVQPSTINKLLYGDPRRTPPQEPSKRVRTETATKILAVELDLAGGAHVDATGTRRRLQALVAIGWSQTRLADQLGWNVGNINNLILGRDCPRVAHSTQVRVRALYDRLWDMPPQPANRFEQSGITRAKTVATKRGWPLPLAWDDETIDDPSATPVVPAAVPASIGPRRDVHATSEDVEFLLGHEPLLTARELADRLGYSNQSGVQHALDRAGRGDLLRRLARNAAVTAGDRTSGPVSRKEAS